MLTNKLRVKNKTDVNLLQKTTPKPHLLEKKRTITQAC